MAQNRFIAYSQYREYKPRQMIGRSLSFYTDVSRRRSIREFDSRPVPKDVLENCIRSAGTAPSGAHKQPWHFVIVSDPEIKKRIRQAAEKEEKEFYAGRAGNEWLADLAPLGTDANKPFLEIAPALIVIFARSYDLSAAGKKSKNYYVQESVGIATGILITALHHSGLACLTHTPSPMGFLSEILDRPANERPYLVLVTGYPAEGVTVPDLSRKQLEQISTFID